MQPIARTPKGGLAARVALLAALLAAVACGVDTPDATTAGAPPLAERVHLLIVDQDAGEPRPEGGRAGALLILSQGVDGAWSAPRPSAFDPGWVDPCDALELPDGSWLVLDSAWGVPDGEIRGAIFRVRVDWDDASGTPAVPELHGSSSPWWSGDPRTRQPVSLARADDGTVFVSDREADPLGLRDAEPSRRTGCVFGIEVGPDGRPVRTEVVAAGPELVTPGALLAWGPLLLLLDADANPRGQLAPDGRPATPGVLFDLVHLAGDRLGPRRPHTLVECEGTTSPIALIARGLGSRPAPAWAPELYLVDANWGTAPEVLGDGALFRVDFEELPVPDEDLVALGLRCTMRPAADTLALGAHALVDPAYGDVLPDGRLVLADANADPRHLGPDGTGKGVYGAAHGAIFAWDPERPGALELLAADTTLVTPVAVRVLRRGPAR
jgi:hypothetical protein